MIDVLIKYAPLNSVGVLISKNSKYHIYIKKVLKETRKNLTFIDIFDEKKVRNIDLKFDFYEFNRNEDRINEHEQYKIASEGMNRKGVYHLANFMAHGYTIYKLSEIVILESSKKDKYLFIDKVTGEFWHSVPSF